MAFGVVMLAAGAALSAVGSIQQGRMQKRAAEFERVQLQSQQKQAEIAALQDERTRREELNRVLSSQVAAAASMGRDPFAVGSSSEAIRKEEVKIANRDVRNIRLMGSFNSNRLGLAAQQKKAEGRAYATAGYLGAGASLFGAGHEAYRSGYFS